MNSRFCLGVRAHDFGRHALEELAHIVSSHGFAAVQLALKKAPPSRPGVPGLSGLLGRLSPGVARSVRRYLQARGISIAVLGCYINPVSAALPAGAGELNYPPLLSLLRRHKPGIDILLESVAVATVGESVRYTRDMEAQL